MSNLATRILTALAGIPLLLFIVIQGGWWFAAFIGLLCALGVKEFNALAEHKAAHPQKSLTAITAFLIPLFIQLDIESSGTHTLQLVVFYILALLITELFRNKLHALFNVAASLGGLAYVCVSLLCLQLLRNMRLEFTPQTDPAWQVGAAGVIVIAMFVSVWLCDSAAYFVGRKFGKHKLFARVSPKKSWEGAIAGLVASALAFPLLLSALLYQFPMTHAVVIGLLIGVVGPLGDLSESLLKRDANIKDSGGLIPGHGGVLDRFDSIMFVAPVLWLYLKMFL